MNFKKTVLFAALLFLLPFSNSFAQGWYIGLGGGYGFPVVGTLITTSLSPTNNSSLNTQVLSYGQGINAGLYVGYMFNKNIGLELNASYLSGTNTTVSYIVAYYNGPTVTDALAFNGDMIRLTPCFRIQTGEGLFRPYTDIGFIYGLETTATNTTTSNPPSTSSGSGKFNGGYSYGFHGALGVKIMCSESIAIFIEVAANYQNYTPVKEVFNDGSQIDFVSSGNVSTTSGNTSYQPQVLLPFSSVGIDAGVEFSFVKQAKTTTK